MEPLPATLNIKHSGMRIECLLIWKFHAFRKGRPLVLRVAFCGFKNTRPHFDTLLLSFAKRMLLLVSLLALLICVLSEE